MKISEEFAKDILITAVEGGSTYWAYFTNYDPDAGAVVVQEFDWTAVGDPRLVTWEDIVVGVEKLFSEKAVANWVLEQFEEEDVDAIGADCAMQMVMFEEVIYG